MNGRTVRRRRLSNSAERQIRERHIRRMKKLQRRRMIFRSTLLVICVVIILSGIVFLTPIFDIRSLNVEGNNRVSYDAILQQLPDVVGENLFKVSEDTIQKRLSSISYVQAVEIDKDYFPSEITVIITEKQPRAVIESDGVYSIIDAECTILEENPEDPESVPAFRFYHESFSQLVDDSEAMEEISNFFEITERIAISDKITAIELLENNEINFEYEGRLRVICGSGLDMEQKLRLLKASVNNSGLDPNAHGEIDLSTSGKAMYTS